MFGSSLDFTKKPEVVIKAVKALDGKIVDVHYADNELYIDYLCPVTRNPLVSQAEAVKEIVESVREAKGAETLKFVGVILHEPTVDKHNNKGSGKTMELYWDAPTLAKINWKGLQDWQFLGLVDQVDLGPLGADALKKYCGERHGSAEAFCRKAGAW